MAQQWAEQLASSNSLKHSNVKYWGQPVGENVAAKSGSQHVDYTGLWSVVSPFTRSTVHSVTWHSVLIRTESL